MGESTDRIEVSGDAAATTPSQPPRNQESLQRGSLLLQHSIEQLRHLQNDYRQARTWLENMEQQIAQREAQIGRDLQEMASLLAQSSGMQTEHGPAFSLATPGNSPAGGLPLQIQTLGKFQVFYQGQSISLGSNKKGRAVFRYLTAHPRQRASKDELLEHLWPEESPEQSTHKLHIAVSALRQALSESLAPALQDQESIFFEDDSSSLNPAIGIDLDTDAFNAHWQAGRDMEQQGLLQEATAQYEAALALYRGDFLPEDLYADWSAAPRARLEEKYLMLLNRLAEGYLQQERFTASITCCRQILSKDSFREDAYRQIMRCYYRMGRRNQALREFLACEQVLQRELGVQPMQETIALYERIAREEAV